MNAHRTASALARAGLDDPRPALLRRDERLRPPRLGSHVPWPEVAAARFLVGAALAVALARTSGARRSRVTDRRGPGRAASSAPSRRSCAFYAITSPPHPPWATPPRSAPPRPIFVALLSAPLLGERVGRRLWLAVAIAFAGIVLVLASVVHRRGAGRGGGHAGRLLLRPRHDLASDASGRGESARGRRAALLAGRVRHHDWCSPFRSGARPRRTTSAGSPSPDVTGGLAQLAMTRAYALDRAARVSALTFVGIVFTYLLAVPVFGERPGWSRRRVRCWSWPPGCCSRDRPGWRRGRRWGRWTSAGRAGGREGGRRPPERGG